MCNIKIFLITLVRIINISILTQWQWDIDAIYSDCQNNVPIEFVNIVWVWVRMRTAENSS